MHFWLKISQKKKDFIFMKFNVQYNNNTQITVTFLNARYVMTFLENKEFFTDWLYYVLYSTDLVGSSKNMRGGLLTSSRAMDRRFLCPPDKLLVLVFFVSSSPRVSKISSTCKHQRNYIKPMKLCKFKC